MRALLTGGSSLTEPWFARAVHARGCHAVTALRRLCDEYAESIRVQRAIELKNVAECIFGIASGDAQFPNLCKRERWDLPCHHAAEVGNCRSPTFDVERAVAANTRNFPVVPRGIRGVAGEVLTGSVFGASEGEGTPPLDAFSPYGGSKGLTATLIRQLRSGARASFRKFVTPNDPFGSYEEPRFCAYFMRQWQSGEVGEVRAPAYVRDNIHVDLLTGTCARFAESVPGGPAPIRVSPSLYAERQGAFRGRLHAATYNRFGHDRCLVLREQTEFTKPRIRVNTACTEMRDWNEDAAWDAIPSFCGPTPTNTK